MTCPSCGSLYPHLRGHSHLGLRLTHCHVAMGNHEAVTPCRDSWHDEQPDDAKTNACEGCRHWRIPAPGAALGKCCVSGSFRAPGGLFTEGGFWCCHWTKS